MKHYFHTVMLLYGLALLLTFIIKGKGRQIYDRFIVTKLPLSLHKALELSEVVEEFPRRLRIHVINMSDASFRGVTLYPHLFNFST